MSEHKAATFATHVGHYNIKKLVYFEEHSDIRVAIRREKTIKKWKKQWKINQVTEMNPDWIDLSLDWDLSKYMAACGCLGLQPRAKLFAMQKAAAGGRIG